MSWLKLSLTFKGQQISVGINGKQVASLTDTAFKSGMAAIGSGWHHAAFDNFTASI